MVTIMAYMITVFRFQIMMVKFGNLKCLTNLLKQACSVVLNNPDIFKRDTVFKQKKKRKKERQKDKKKTGPCNFLDIYEDSMHAKKEKNENNNYTLKAIEVISHAKLT